MVEVVKLRMRPCLQDQVAIFAVVLVVLIAAAPRLAELAAVPAAVVRIEPLNCLAYLVAAHMLAASDLVLLWRMPIEFPSNWYPLN